MTNLARTSPIRIAVFISGGGTTLRNLIEKIQADDLSAEIAVVISSDQNAGGLSYAIQADIPTCVAQWNSSTTAADYRDVIFRACRDADVELVVMGGFLKHVLIPEDFEGRVINIHPSLIPAFCGRGYYGLHVHRAVLERGTKVTGCTVHFVDNEFDHGPIIEQRCVSVEEDDTPESLARRVFQQECEALPETIRKFSEQKLVIEGRRVRIRN